MSRKYSTDDREVFKQVYLQFAWIPVSHLAGMMRCMAGSGALPAKWEDLSGQTVSQWITKHGWRDEVERLAQLVVDDSQPLPSDDEVDDLVMRRNLQVFDILMARILGEAGDFSQNVKRFVDLQAQIRNHVGVRRALPLTPTMLIELLVQAGVYAAGGRFKEERAKQFLKDKFAMLRQAVPLKVIDAQSTTA